MFQKQKRMSKQIFSVFLSYFSPENIINVSEFIKNVNICGKRMRNKCVFEKHMSFKRK